MYYFFNPCAFCTQKPSIIFRPKFEDSKTGNGRVAQSLRERERGGGGGGVSKSVSLAANCCKLREVLDKDDTDRVMWQWS